MEIIVENDGLNGVANYEPLKAWALEKTSMFKGLVVTEDNLAIAKTDVAELRKIAKSASDYRIAIKKANDYKIENTVNQLKEITDIFSSAAESVATQVNEIESGFKEEKKKELKSYFDSVVGDLNGIIEFDGIFEQRWLNKGEQIENIKESIVETLNKIRKGISSIRGMNDKYENEMIDVFVQTLDMTNAIDEKKRLEEQERKMNAFKSSQDNADNNVSVEESVTVVADNEETNVEEEVGIYDVRLYMTPTQKNMFKKFVVDNGIKYTAVPK